MPSYSVIQPLQFRVIYKADHRSYDWTKTAYDRAKFVRPIILIGHFFHIFTFSPLHPDFLWKNWPYPKVPCKIFDFSNPEFSSSSSRRVFSSRLRALFKTVTIAWIPRKIAEQYNMDLPGGVWIPISRKKIVFVFYQISSEPFGRISCDHFIFFPFTE